VHHAVPHVRVVDVGLGGHAEDLLDLRADVDRQVAAVLIDHGRHLLDQAAVSGLDIEELPHGLTPGEHLAGIADRDDRLRARVGHSDLHGQRVRARARELGLEGLVAVAAPAVNQHVDPLAARVGAEQRAGAIVGSHDDARLEHEERLGRAVEQPGVIEAGLDGGVVRPFELVRRKHRSLGETPEPPRNAVR
jgi:hypothetical protein